MKNLKSLILAGVGLLISIIGLSFYINQNPLGPVLMIIGGILLFLFYFITLFQVINSKTIHEKRRVTWIIFIVCLPVIGNIIYIIIHDALTTRQKPKEQF